MTRVTRAWAVCWFMACVVAGGCSDADEADSRATSSPADPSAGTYHVEVEVGERSYDIYAPPGSDLRPLAPVVLAFHGMPGSPDTISRESELTILADEMGFLAVFPRGEDQRWEPEAGGRDVDYVEALIGDLVDSWGADPDRIYATGFSNGADMAIVSALSLRDLISGVALVTPSGTGSVAKVIDDVAAPVPIVAFIGESDSRAELGLDMLEAWRSGVGCDEADPGEPPAGVMTMAWTCGGVPFRVHVVAYQGHVWFGAADDRKPLWASETMWEFFSELG